MRNTLRVQGISRHSDTDIIEAGLSDWRAVLSAMSSDSFFFGEEPASIDATVFGALATTILALTQSR